MISQWNLAKNGKIGDEKKVILVQKKIIIT